MTALTTIRRAAEADLDALKTLRHGFFDSQITVGLLDLPTDLDAIIDTGTANLIAGRRSDVFVSETNKLHGYLYAITRIVPGYRQPTVAAIEEFFVEPDLRGTGVAEALLETAIGALNARGADRIQLRVLVGNAAGHAFWAKTGFIENVRILEFDRTKSR